MSEFLHDLTNSSARLPPRAAEVFPREEIYDVFCFFFSSTLFPGRNAEDIKGASEAQARRGLASARARVALSSPVSGFHCFDSASTLQALSNKVVKEGYRLSELAHRDQTWDFATCRTQLFDKFLATQDFIAAETLGSW